MFKENFRIEAAMKNEKFTCKNLSRLSRNRIFQWEILFEPPCILIARMTFVARFVFHRF